MGKILYVKFDVQNYSKWKIVTLSDMLFFKKNEERLHPVENNAEQFHQISSTFAKNYGKYSLNNI